MLPEKIPCKYYIRDGFSDGSSRLETSKTSSNGTDGTMERSTDTITGDDNIQTLLLERYPSSQDVRTDDDDSHDEGKPVESRVHFPLNERSDKVACSVRDDDLWKESVDRFDSGGRISESLMASAIFSDANGLNGMSLSKRIDPRSLLSPSVTPTPLKMIEVNHHASPVNSPTRPRRTSRHLPSGSSTDSIHSDLNDSFHEHNLAVVRRQLGPDGLAILHDERQIRLRQIRDVYQVLLRISTVQSSMEPLLTTSVLDLPVTEGVRVWKSSSYSTFPRLCTKAEEEECFGRNSSGRFPLLLFS